MKNKVLTVMAIIVIIWCFASYCNTLTNIDNGTYNYAWWNLITIIFSR